MFLVIMLVIGLTCGWKAVLLLLLLLPLGGRPAVASVSPLGRR
jgi:hypothetical protein